MAERQGHNWPGKARLRTLQGRQVFNFQQQVPEIIADPALLQSAFNSLFQWPPFGDTKSIHLELQPLSSQLRRPHDIQVRTSAFLRTPLFQNLKDAQ